MRLPMSLLLKRSSFCFDKDMSSSNTFSIKLPYVGAILLGKSPLNLTSFQKPLRELYIPYYHEHSHDERRIIISDYDILIFEPDAASQGKRTFIYSNFESIVDIQILKFSVMMNNKENQQHKRIQAAFLPIGGEHQERFHSLYSKINRSQYNLLSTSTSSHPPLLLFVIRKPGVGNSCSLLDCHVFAVHRELAAFELCDMLRKLIIKRTMSPILSKRRTLLCKQDNNKEISTIDHREKNNHLISNVNSNDVVHTPSNPLSSTLLVINNVQHSPSYDTSKVLTMNSDIHHMSSLKQRQFTKASTLIDDEGDEIINDLMNIVATEKLKTQGSIKRRASLDQISNSDDNTMNKKRYFHNKKRLLNPIPTINTNSHQQKINSRIGGHLLRPEIVLNRYGDIGNYVPKFLRENITMRSSDSNENIFFRSTNGQLLNGFLKLDFLPTKSIKENYYQSTPCLNQTDSILDVHNLDMEANHTDDDHRVPHVLKSMGDILNDIKIHSFTSTSHKSNMSVSSSKPKRVASFTITDTELPVDYRQYLRHTDQGAYLYGEKQHHQTTFEHSLGYFP